MSRALLNFALTALVLGIGLPTSSGQPNSRRSHARRSRAGSFASHGGAGLSQAALARPARIDPATLNRIEKPKVTPDQKTVPKIDRALTAAATRPRKVAPAPRRSTRPQPRAAAKK